MFNYKIKKISIKRINFVLFFLMFSLFWLVLFLDFLNDYNIYIGFIILLVFIIYSIFNYLYLKEFEKSKLEIKNIIKYNNGFLLKKNYYKENTETNNIFNKFLLNNNILKKDFLDLENALHKFTAHYFLKEIFKKGIDRLELGMSMRKYVHVMFLDIIGFTSFTEKLEPSRALLLLNIYFDGIVEIVKKHGGFVDKFLGDGMLVIFPFRSSDNVLQASTEIQKYIKQFSISEIGKKISIGIGINSGLVIMGTIGSKKRMEVTIIGDSVNTASRIEDLTREYNCKIIISESTYKLAKNKNNFKVKYLGEKILKGKTNKRKIYGISELDQN